MTNEVENLVLEHLKKMQIELGNARERDREILSRLTQIENKLAGLTREVANAYQDRIEDRHSLDSLVLRVERIERRLEIGDA